MTSAFTERRAEYARGDVARSVRTLRLAGRSLREAHLALIKAGFVLRPERIVAERTADGAPQWLCIDGTATASPSDPKLAPLDCYLHPDGGMVRVFPAGDPRGRLVPAGKPSAIKSVLFDAPDLTAGAVVSFRDEAFRVTDEGHAVPKSARAAYGARHDPLAPASSYYFASGVLEQAILALTVDRA